MLEPSADPIRFDEVIVGRVPADRARSNQHLARETSASGLAAVWARDNTREALWDAMARKEVYATTGTRLQVRVFGGFDFTAKDLERSDFAEQGYQRGVPMGGDLKAAPAGKAPDDADPRDARRRRCQPRPRAGHQGLARRRRQDTREGLRRGLVGQPQARRKDGKLPPVGNTVNVEGGELHAMRSARRTSPRYWKDPDFDAKQRAFYYVRVLEIPTPRWTTFDAKVFGVKLPTDVPASIQERAYTSPIWYTPG